MVVTAVRQGQLESQELHHLAVVVVLIHLVALAQVLLVKSSSQYSQHKEKSWHTNVY
jgi:hypothetical protein